MKSSPSGDELSNVASSGSMRWGMSTCSSPRLALLVLRAVSVLVALAFLVALAVLVGLAVLVALVAFVALAVLVALVAFVALVATPAAIALKSRPVRALLASLSSKLV